MPFQTMMACRGKKEQIERKSNQKHKLLIIYTFSYTWILGIVLKLNDCAVNKKVNLILFIFKQTVKGNFNANLMIQLSKTTFFNQNLLLL